MGGSVDRVADGGDGGVGGAHISSSGERLRGQGSGSSATLRKVREVARVIFQLVILTVSPFYPMQSVVVGVAFQTGAYLWCHHEIYWGSPLERALLFSSPGHARTLKDRAEVLEPISWLFAGVHAASAFYHLLLGLVARQAPMLHLASYLVVAAAVDYTFMRSFGKVKDAKFKDLRESFEPIAVKVPGHDLRVAEVACEASKDSSDRVAFWARAILSWLEHELSPEDYGALEGRIEPENRERGDAELDTAWRLVALAKRLARRAEGERVT